MAAILLLAGCAGKPAGQTGEGGTQPAPASGTQGGSDSGTQGVSGAAAPGTQGGTDTPASGGSGSGEEPIRVGGLYILSGTLAGYGKAGSQGLQMAVDEINQAGGILGRPVELVVADEQGKPEVAVREAKRLVQDWGADVLVGIDSSGSVLAVADALNELQKPLLVTHAATPKLTHENFNRYAFRVTSDARMDAYAAAMLAAELPYTRWATISPDYEFGRVSWEDFKTKLKELKPDVEFVAEAWPALGATDFTNHITTVMAAQPEGVFSVVWGGDLVTFVKQAKGFGFFDQIDIFVDPVGASISVLAPLGKETPENLLVSTRYWFLYPDTPANKKFVQDYYNRFGEYPDYVAHEGYAAVYMYKKAAEQVRSTDPEQIIAALEGMTWDAPEGTKLIRAEDHQVFKDLVWGYTKHTDEYPFAILDRMTIIPKEQATYPPGNVR